MQSQLPALLAASLLACVYCTCYVRGRGLNAFCVEAKLC
eukprot:COSAG01_NODE_14606_length_1433_cov_2.414543_1_plen_38_part_10